MASSPSFAPIWLLHTSEPFCTEGSFWGACQSALLACLLCTMQLPCTPRPCPTIHPQHCARHCSRLPASIQLLA